MIFYGTWSCRGSTVHKKNIWGKHSLEFKGNSLLGTKFKSCNPVCVSKSCMIWSVFHWVPLTPTSCFQRPTLETIRFDPFRSISGFPSWSICWLCWYLVIQRRVLLIKYLRQIEKLSIWDGFRSLQWPKCQETPIFPICISGVSTDRSTSKTMTLRDDYFTIVSR